MRSNDYIRPVTGDPRKYSKSLRSAVNKELRGTQ